MSDEVCCSGCTHWKGIFCQKCGCHYRDCATEYGQVPELKKAVAVALAALFIFATIAIYTPAHATAGSVVQAAQNSNSASSSITCALGSTVTAGDTIIVDEVSSQGVNTRGWSDSLSNSVVAAGASSAPTNPLFSNGLIGTGSAAAQSAPPFFQVGTGGASDTITFPVSGGSSGSNMAVCAEISQTYYPMVQDHSSTNQGSGTGATSAVTAAASFTPTTGSLLVLLYQVSACGGFSGAVTLPSGFTAAETSTPVASGTTGCAQTWSTELIIATDPSWAGGASTFSATVTHTNAPSISETYNQGFVMDMILVPAITTTTTTTSTTTTTTTTTTTVLAAGIQANATLVQQITPGKTLLLSSTVTGGTGSGYTYQWYSGSSATCSSDVTTLGTAATQAVSPVTSTFYCYKVTDGGSNVQSSATIDVTVAALQTTTSTVTTTTTTATTTTSTSTFTTTQSVTSTVTITETYTTTVGGGGGGGGYFYVQNSTTEYGNYQGQGFVGFGASQIGVAQEAIIVAVVAIVGLSYYISRESHVKKFNKNLAKKAKIKDEKPKKGVV